VEIMLEIKEEKIIIGFGSSDIEDIIYSLENEINLTQLVNVISELDKELTPKPINFEAFTGTVQQANPTLTKVVEYIYKVIETYNLCFRKVYETQTQENKESIA